MAPNPITLARHAVAFVMGAIDRFLARLFKPASRYPADPRAVFILVIGVFSGLTALALDAAPPTLQSVLPGWVIVLWSLILVIGSGATLIGMMLQTLEGIITEQVGSVAVGVAAIFYSVIAFWLIGADAAQTVGVIFAWGVACLIRWGQLQALINQSYRQKIRSEIEASIREGLEEYR